MSFFADLHIHSKYSRATSRDCDLEHLAWWAQRKGISVVGTGDFTHPAWWDEINEKLVPAEPGLYRLRPDLEREVAATLPASCRRPMRFMLEVEISTIYKKGDKTRKVHHLIYAAHLETAGRFRDKLGSIGNIKSDGRPILGLDSRHLLEITLEAGDDAYLIPAHIWTPWFAAMGSKSGFDSIDDCYGDLASHIFAVETGLSSDPPMNWRVSHLDRFTLVSNSDAHSPPMLGREANVFDTEMDYFAMRRALETRTGFGGTVEFFPEEGKYHLDGHRACATRLNPDETRANNGNCPSCGKPVTVGVLHRVETLADRPRGDKPAVTSPFRSLVQLPEVIGELHGVGPKTKTVGRAVDALTARLGPELEILEQHPIEDVARFADPLLGEALRRLRAGNVRCDSGYDGEYGTVRLFDPTELRPQLSLFKSLGVTKPKRRRQREPNQATSAISDSSTPAKRATTTPEKPVETGSVLDHLDPDQRRAAEITQGPLLIVAGPGTGKTRTLTHRIAHLLDTGVPASAFLAITFTRRAANEMRERLEALRPESAAALTVSTFHGLGLTILREQAAKAGLHRGFRVADQPTQVEVAAGTFGWSKTEATTQLRQLNDARRTAAVNHTDPDPETTQQIEQYREALACHDLVDFDDLLILPVALLRKHPDLRDAYRDRWRQVSIDEYQDIDAVQYQLVQLLVPAGGNLCAIGDPDQSIYQFRGAEVGFFLRFRQDHPTAQAIELGRNYRSQANVVAAAMQVIRPTSLVPERRLEAHAPLPPAPITVLEASSTAAEAEQVAHSIEQMIGGTSYFSIDSGRVDDTGLATPDLSFNDISVLYRTKAQALPVAEALARSGMPFQQRSHERLSDHDGVRLLLHELDAQPKITPPRDLIALLDRVRSTISGADEAPVNEALELLRPLAARHGDDLEAFRRSLALGAEVDTWDPRAERISLLTLHAAKGLEFPVVFIIGCDDGLMPLTWSGADDCDEDEERRLFFVGMTRARHRLILSWARQRRWRGEARDSRPSPFLDAIEVHLLDHRRGRAPRKRREPKAEQLSLL